MLSAERAWAGIDAGKGHHHVVVIDGEGRRLLSRRVANDETELSELVDVALQLTRTLTWAIDLADCAAALMITLLLDRGQRVLVPARHRGEPRGCCLPRRRKDRREGCRHHRRSGPDAP